jgi:hypothetical protein
MGMLAWNEMVVQIYQFASRFIKRMAVRDVGGVGMILGENGANNRMHAAAN